MTIDPRIVLVALGLATATVELCAAPDAHARAPRKSEPRARPKKNPKQKEADQRFKRGVALFNEAKYAEALAEFERAYEIAPHPLVLYNIAGCHRQMSHYADAVSYYRRFLAEGKGVVPAARLTAAQSELDATLLLIARVTVTVSPAIDGTTLLLDGAPLDTTTMPLVLPPGEHRLTARAAGRPDAERTVRVASGDEVAVELVLTQPPLAREPPGEAPESTATPTRMGVEASAAPAAPRHRNRHFGLGAGFGTNLRIARDTGAPSLSLALPVGSRLELGLDGVFVGYSVIPSIRVRLAGEAFALHAVGAVPVSFNDGSTMERFVAVAGGLGLRYQPLAGFAVRLESYAAYAGKAHGGSIPMFLGGELWF
jgi:Tfp pilus assembly protein PilF